MTQYLNRREREGGKKEERKIRDNYLTLKLYLSFNSKIYKLQCFLYIYTNEIKFCFVSVCVQSLTKFISHRSLKI